MAQTILYHLSLNSPWTYMGHARFLEIAERHGASVVYKPTNYRIVFPETGGLPLPQRPPARRAYRLQELERWSAFNGVPLNKLPAFHPADERAAVGMVLAAIERGLDPGPMVIGVLTAQWAEERDIGDADTLLAIAAERGYADPAGLLADGSSDAMTAAWERHSQDALAAGVFGAPTYVLGEQLFWGQDRLDFLDRALAQT